MNRHTMVFGAGVFLAGWVMHWCAVGWCDPGPNSPLGFFNFIAACTLVAGTVIFSAGAAGIPKDMEF